MNIGNETLLLLLLNKGRCERTLIIYIYKHTFPYFFSLNNYKLLKWEIIMNRERSVEV